MLWFFAGRGTHLQVGGHLVMCTLTLQALSLDLGSICAVGALLASEASWPKRKQHIGRVAPAKVQENHDSVSREQVPRNVAENTLEPSTDSPGVGKTLSVPLKQSHLWDTLPAGLSGQ